ncbi:hypothetical protein Tco_0987776 [Tanacetum coccineum]
MSSRNKNNQKNESKKSKNVSDGVNQSMEFEGENEFMVNTEEFGNEGSMGNTGGDTNESGLGDQKDCSGEKEEGHKEGKLNVEEVVLVNEEQSVDQLKIDGTAKGINQCESSVNKKDQPCDGNANTKEGNQNSYVHTLLKSINVADNQLFTIPTSVNCKGEGVVLFDEEMVKEGSEKWLLTVCGYFVGCKMHVNELKYNIRRMWRRYGLKEIVVDADEMCFF